jgi:ATP-dependent Lon protease
MNVPLARALVLVVGLACSLRGEEDTPKSSVKDLLKARIAEDAKKVDPKKAPATPPPAKPTTATPATETAKEDPTPAKPAPSGAKETPTVLPKVEVKKGRITELDQKIAKQEQDIARERKNLKASEVDTALNDSKTAKPLAIFGGESSQFRQRVASERVELMEAEKEILEAMAHAKTKEEKKELQKQLDEIKTVRRDLEKSLR